MRHPPPPSVPPHHLILLVRDDEGMKGRAEHFLQSHWSHWILSGGGGGNEEKTLNNLGAISSSFFWKKWQAWCIRRLPPPPGAIVTNQAELSDPLDISVAQRANKESGPLLLPAAAVEEAWLCGSPPPPPIPPCLSYQLLGCVPAASCVDSGVDSHRHLPHERRGDWRS